MFAITFFHLDFFQKNNRSMNQKLQAVIAFLLLSTGAWHLSAQNAVVDYLQRADKQFELGAYNVAVITLEEVLRQEPGNTSALARKADCMVQLNRPFEALALYDRALFLGHSDPEVKLRYGHALMLGGDYVGAKRWYTQYAVNNPIVGQHFAAAAEQAIKTNLAPSGYSVRAEAINTSGSEFGAAFLGDKLVFNSSRKDMPRSHKNGDAGVNELYIASVALPEGQLQSPAYFLPEAQNNLLMNEGPISFNRSATKAVFASNKLVEGSRQISPKGMEMALYVADVNAEGKLLNIQSFPYNKEGYGLGFPYLSEDGNTLLFASNLPEGLGGWDLYVSNFDPLKGTWSLPRNLGGLVNTPGNEITPYVDGTRLYFASDWHFGLGGLDIFKAEFQNGYATNVTNLGKGVNSSRDDYGFIYQNSKRKGYFTSNRSEGKGNEDIWQVSELTEQFAIIVRDPHFQPVADAEIDLTACNGGTIRTDQAGRALFLGGWNAGTCAVSIKKPGYTTVFLSINPSSDRNIAVTLVALPNAVAEAQKVKTPAQLSEALGTILDAETKDPVMGATVTATPMPMGTKVEATSNTFGQYTLLLEPNRSYTISFIAKGYMDQVLNFYSSGAGNQSTVSQVSLKKNIPSAARGEEGQAAFAWTTPTVKVSDAVVPAPLSAQKENQPAASTKEPIKSKSAPQENEPSTTARNATFENQLAPAKVMDGFAVQLTAFVTGATDVELSQFEELKQYGNFYQIREDQKNKLRMGVYADRTTAEFALQKARAVKKDAFLVEEKNINRDWAFQPTMAEPVMSPMIVSKNPIAEPTAAPVLMSNAASLSYAVRVKSTEVGTPMLLNDLADLGQFGSLYTNVENGVLQVRVGPWASLADAERAQLQIASKGYREAVVVLEKAQVDAPATPASLVRTSNREPVRDPVPSSNMSNKTPRGVLPDLIGAAPVSAEELAPVLVEEAEADVEYMVRICSLSGDLSAFDVKKAEQAGGTVDARKSKTGNYILLLTGFAKKEDAQLATQKIIELGYKEAYLVKEKQGDGILRRVVH